MLPNAELAKGKADRAAKAGIVEDLAADFNPVSLLAALVHDEKILSVPGLFERSQMDRNVFNESLNVLSSAPDTYKLLEFGTPRNFIAAEAFDTIARSALRILHEFHAKFPELSGLEAEKLYASMDSIHGAGWVKSGDFKDLVGIMAARNVIVPVDAGRPAGASGKTCYRAADYRRSSLDGKLIDIVERARDAMASAGFKLLKLPELEEKLGVSSSDMKRAAAYLREQDGLRIIEDGFLFSREVREKLLTALVSMDGDITVAAVRDSLGVGRKDTSAMLEFLDSQGLTRRDGDTRVLAG
jgi:selenocysteine-specific elongation factor